MCVLIFPFSRVTQWLQTFFLLIFFYSLVIVFDAKTKMSPSVFRCDYAACNDNLLATDWEEGSASSDFYFSTVLASLSPDVSGSAGRRPLIHSMWRHAAFMCSSEALTEPVQRQFMQNSHRAIVSAKSSAY